MFLIFFSNFAMHSNSIFLIKIKIGWIKNRQRLFFASTDQAISILFNFFFTLSISCLLSVANIWVKNKLALISPENLHSIKNQRQTKKKCFKSIKKFPLKLKFFPIAYFFTFGCLVSTANFDTFYHHV